jgi:general secretion pathway protein G
MTNLEKTMKYLNKPFGKSTQKALTLIEIIIVVALIATLMGIIVRNVSTQADSAKEDQTRIQMGNVFNSMQMYRVHNNKYPTSEQGLSALVKDPGSKRWRGPYIEASKLKDAWGNDFDYESDGHTFKITSGGKGGQVGDEDDIVYPEAEEE